MTTIRRSDTAESEEKRILKRLAELQGEPKLHGSLCIHFAQGEPKTIEVKHQRTLGG